MITSAGVLHNYLQEIEGNGWTAASLKGDCWETRYQSHPVGVRLTRNWISVYSPVDGINNNLLALEWNSRILIAKLCRPFDGAMVLKAEWPADEMNFSSLRFLMTATARALEMIDNTSLEPSTGGLKDSTVERLALYIPKERIWRYVRQIDRSGWSLGAEPENTRWHFLYHGHICNFHVQMEFTEHWTHFQARLPSSANERSPQADMILFKHMLALNGGMRMARFRLSQNSAILSLHCPTERLNFKMFEICMQAMGVYLDRMGPEMILLASSERLGQFIDSGVLPPVEDFLGEEG